MSATRKARLLRDGDDQVVVFPLGFELPGEEVMISKVGDSLIIKPLPDSSPETLAAFLAALDAI